ncbi:MAG: hypothetical protein ACKPBA_09085 [Planctomycetota bacterium]
MGAPTPAPERVGQGLLWGLGFSVAFHVILFSPQLAALLDPEQRHEAIAVPQSAAERKAAEARKDPARDERRPDEPKPPDATKPPDAQAERPPDAPPPEERPKGEQPPATPPLPPELTPQPVPAYPDVEDVAIGQDEGDPMSVVIIGRDDYEEHMAQLSVVSQAGFKMSDAGGDGTVGYGRGDRGDGGGGGGSAPNATATTVAAATPGTPTLPDSTRTESAAPAPQPDGPAQPDMPATPPDAPVTPLARPEPKPEPAPPAPPAPPQPPAESPPPAEPVPAPAPEPPTAPAEDGKPPIPVPPVEQPKPAPVTPAPPAAPAAPAEPKPAPQAPANQPPAAQPGGGIASTERPKDGAKSDAPGEAGKAGGSGPSPTPGTGGKGQLSDLESPATSVTAVDAKLWKNGRLVAAQGVQLKPRQPQFTTLQIVSLLPGCRPPVVSLTFDRTGKCIDVFFNLSSGDSEIDGVIRNSLFFWRAAGKKIEQLKDGEKVRVTLQLLL